MTATLDCQTFLARTTVALVAAGATPLLPADGNRAEWDQVLIDDTPGTRALYAFACAKAGPELQAAVDRLAERLLQSGSLAGGPLSLVVISLYAGGLGRNSAQTLRRVTPSVFYEGLRPEAWAVDLAEGRVYGPAMGRGAGTRKVLAAAFTSEGPAGPIDMDLAQTRHAEQRYSFYQLMRGRQPFVTYGLIAVNVVMYLLLYAQGGPGSERALVMMGALVPRLVEHGEWWRLFSEMFLHGGDVHILFNMMSLFVVGTLAERLYGSPRFLAIYLGSGVIGSVVSLLYAITLGDVNSVGVGASGAIFGVAGALITVRFQPSDVIPAAVRGRISSAMLPLVALSLGLSYFTANVDNSAHVGGLLGGMALSFLLPLTRQTPLTPK